MIYQSKDQDSHNMQTVNNEKTIYISPFSTFFIAKIFPTITTTDVPLGKFPGLPLYFPEWNLSDTTLFLGNKSEKFLMLKLSVYNVKVNG